MTLQCTGNLLGLGAEGCHFDFYLNVLTLLAILRKDRLGQREEGDDKLEGNEVI